MGKLTCLSHTNMHDNYFHVWLQWVLEYGCSMIFRASHLEDFSLLKVTFWLPWLASKARAMVVCKRLVSCCAHQVDCCWILGTALGLCQASAFAQQSQLLKTSLVPWLFVLIVL